MLILKPPHRLGRCICVEEEVGGGGSGEEGGKHRGDLSCLLPPMYH